MVESIAVIIIIVVVAVVVGGLTRQEAVFWVCQWLEDWHDI